VRLALLQLLLVTSAIDLNNGYIVCMNLRPCVRNIKYSINQVEERPRLTKRSLYDKGTC